MIAFIFRKLGTRTFTIKFRESTLFLRYILKIEKSKNKFKSSIFKEKLEAHQEKIMQVYKITFKRIATHFTGNHLIIIIMNVANKNIC